MREITSISTRIVASGLCGLLVWTSALGAWADFGPPPPLAELVEEPYLILLERADELNFSKKELDAFRKQLKKEKKAEERQLKQEEKKLQEQIENLKSELADLNQSASYDNQGMTLQRQDLHCQILTLEKELNKKQTKRKQGVSVAYDNKRAKVDLVEKWPARQEEIWNVLESGQARARRFGDVEDIGVRVIREGQEKDIEVGEEAVRDMKNLSVMPPELENEEISAYVRRLADKIAAHSDLRVPLQVTVLDSEEINAFALPGGFLFINRGLIEKAETESELVGVIAHETAHVTARHGNRLMKKASIANIIYQAAQVGAMILTGGVASLGTYYALQYGFMGLGMALNLTLLGVSRDFEEEADQLGAQYAWNAGYDPKGFITFFDKMATEKGYVRSASFFRTHPAFFDRIVATFGEIEYLPPKDDLIVDSTEFREAKALLKEVAPPKSTNVKTKRPTLRRGPPCDEDHPKMSHLRLADG